jgi:hypothetical protein
MSPPIREAGHGKALQAALSSGILQVTHSCHTLNCGVKQIAYCLSVFFSTVELYLLHRIDGILIAERQCYITCYGEGNLCCIFHSYINT